LGIGFIVVKKIVEEYHNGTIKVLNSEIGKEQQCRLVLKVV
jgi:nitrogen fixation/metabolism regulation signal transduction histidine kinase